MYSVDNTYLSYLISCNIMFGDIMFQFQKLKQRKKLYIKMVWVIYYGKL